MNLQKRRPIETWLDIYLSVLKALRQDLRARNYFDVHDTDEIASKYVKADFGPVSGDSRVRILEGELGTMRDRLEKLESIYSETLKIKES